MKADSNFQKPSTFPNGQAIKNAAEDRLKRSPMAESFATAIANHQASESLVLAINGPWGEGKTSFKNILCDYLAKDHGDKVVLVEFSPWEWASQNQLAEAFFSEISKQLNANGKSEEANTVANRLQTLGRYLGFAVKWTPIVGPEITENKLYFRV